MPKACPECKSKNTRQLDHATYGNSAYCLSCYNRFASIEKIIEPKSVKHKDYSDETNRYLKNACEDIKRMKSRIKAIEKLLGVADICKEQNNTEAR